MIDLLVPGLTGPVPTPLAHAPNAPRFARLLGRGELLPEAADDPVGALFRAFGGQFAPHQAPSAPFALLDDDPGAEPDLYWFHADPVHLRPDRDRLLLFDARRMALTAEEADELCTLFNAHFADDGLHLLAPTPERWYLGCRQAPRLTTTGLDRVIGRPIESLLPAGDDARRWMALLNEAQMLFHQSACNRAREETGRPTISGIWPWGGGRRADFQPDADYDRIGAVTPLARGLATAAGVAVASGTPDLDGRVLIETRQLQDAVLDADAEAWTRGIEGLEALFGRLADHVSSRRGGSVLVDACDGRHRYAITRARLRRFWRRPIDWDVVARGKQ